MSKLTLHILTQEKHLLTQKVDQLTAPASMGEVTILPGHIPLFTRLNDGIVSYRIDHNDTDMAILGGFMDVGPNGEVTIMADAAIRATEINIAKAELAKKNAEETMKSKKSEQEYRLAENDLRRAILELKFAHRKRNMGSPSNPAESLWS